jgi:glutamine synthetase
VLKTGVEVEFMLLEPAPSVGGKPRHKIPAYDCDPKPCYEINTLMSRYDMIKQLFEYLQNLGWKPYQCDHEDGNGQFELNFTYADALVTADRVAFYKYMVGELARQHGLVATFMPKPFADKTGNGQHVHFSLWDKAETTCVFEDAKGGDEYGLSSLALNFLGGIIDHVQGMAAITNPTVNSYKRLGAPSTDSGATWAPTRCTHGGNDRTHMVRVPDEPHYELRLADMAANSYLLGAVLLAAGMNGIEAKSDPGPRMKKACSECPPGVGKPIPANMLDALRAFEADTKLMATLGDGFSKAYLVLRHKEWQDYCAHLTEWEVDNYFDSMGLPASRL